MCLVLQLFSRHRLVGCTIGLWTKQEGHSRWSDLLELTVKNAETSKHGNVKTPKQDGNAWNVKCLLVLDSFLRDNERHCSEFWWGLQTKMWKLDLRKNVLCLSQKTFSFVSARKHQDSVFVSEDVNFSGSLRKYYLFNLKCFWSLSGCWFSLWCLLLL